MSDFVAALCCTAVLLGYSNCAFWCRCRAELGGEPVIQLAEGGSSNSTATTDSAAGASVFVGGRMKDAPQLVRQGTLAPEDVA